MIDWERVEELKGEVGEEDFAEIAALFLAEIGETVASLPGLAADALPETLHGLKGAALNLGFRDLAALAEAGEKAPSAAPVAELTAAWDASAAAFGARHPALA